jgi:16S rRNA processing protein RimM
MLENHLAVGEVLKPHGIQGWLKVLPLTDDPERFQGVTQLYRRKDPQGAFEPIHVEVHRVRPDAVYLTVDGVEDRTAAEALAGETLYIDREHAVPLGEDANFICDLIGCQAWDTTGRERGILRDVLQHRGGDVYRFEAPEGFFMVPARKRVVLEVDVAARRILLDAERLMEMAVWEA